MQIDQVWATYLSLREGLLLYSEFEVGECGPRVSLSAPGQMFTHSAADCYLDPVALIFVLFQVIPPPVPFCFCSKWPAPVALF